MKNTGQQIKELRLTNNLSLNHTAFYLNIAPSVMGQIEQGVLAPTKNQIFKFAKLFNLNGNDLLYTFQQERINKEIVKNTSFALTKNKHILKERHQNMLMELQKIKTEKFYINIHKPKYPLCEYIESITYYCGHNLDCSTEIVLPDGSVNLWIELDGNERIIKSGTTNYAVKASWVTGVQKQQLTFGLNPFQSCINIRFKPGGFYNATQIPQIELVNAVVDAEVFFGYAIKILRESLGEEKSINALFEKIEAYFLKKYLPQNFNLINQLLHQINEPIKSQSQHTGYSQKHLIVLFKKYFGVTPKYLQRITRFNQAIYQIHTHQEINTWADIAYNNNFFDQAHFIKEFTCFSGMNPQKYIARGSTCTRLVRENSSEVKKIQY